MNLKRWIDRFFFGFFAFFLDCKKLEKKYSTAKIAKKNRITSIAIIKLIGMGDAILQLPSIELLKKSYPKAKIEVWTTSVTAGVFKNQRFIEEVHQLQLKKIFFLIKKLNSYHLVIDFEPFMNFSFLLSRLFVNSKVTIFNSIGFESNLRKVKHPVSKKFIPSIHMVNNYLHLISDLLNLIFLKDGNKIKKLSLLNGNPFHKKIAFDIESYPFPHPEKKVAIAIGAGKVALGRKLPLQTYIEVIEKILLWDKEFRILLIGGALEKKDSIKVMNTFYQKRVTLGERIINLVAQIPLAATFEVMKDVPYFIGNDTGTAHIALAQGCKSILIFGPETEKRYGPLNKESMVINKNLPCSPCIEIWKGKNKTCNDPICTKSISAQEIFEKFSKLIV